MPPIAQGINDLRTIKLNLREFEAELASYREHPSEKGLRSLANWMEKLAQDIRERQGQ